jgi:metallo-beta-lactamase family protein
VPTTLQFLGGTGTVTGSKFLLRDGGACLLVDAGLFQGLRDLRRRNWEPFPVPPEDLDAVALTHAHLDHCGYLPALGREGLACPVYATGATGALAALVLRDSAALQEEDAAYAAQAGYSRHTRPAPLYDRADVERVLPLLQPVETGVAVPVGRDEPTSVRVTFHPAGHILGSTFVSVGVDGRVVTISGDLGRGTHPLLLPPDPLPASDVVLVESTYGDRDHPPDADQPLADVLRRCLGRGGVAVIPAFAVDRTEVVLMALRRLMDAGAVPRVPVFVDSPMALGALAVYRQALVQGSPGLRPDVGYDAFDPGDLREVHDADGSRQLNDPGFACVVVSASGMAAGGRVVHHLKHLLPDPRNAVVLVGFQAAGTRGRALQEGARELKMHGRYVPVRAEVASVEGFSVHADADELVAWLGTAPRPPEVVYLVHGEPSASQALADRVRAELGWAAVVPRDGEIVRLD